MEDKQFICDMLLNALRATDRLKALEERKGANNE